MDFTLTDEEAAVVETAASVTGAADPWVALVEGGWLDLLVVDGDSVADGGSGGLAYLGLVAEALGATGVSVPLIGTAAVWPTLFGGSAGGRRVGVAEAGEGGLAEDGIGAEVLVVWTPSSAKVFEAFTAEAAGGLAGDGLARVRLTGPVVGSCLDAATVAEARRRAAALASAEMAGALRRISEMTTAYVAERHQFGRPISAFQVVAHGAARLATLAEAAVWSARLACTSPEADATHAAKGWVSAASAEASGLAHQLHGAIGFTEEYGLQRLTKRLRTLRFAWGDDGAHHAALGRLRRSS